MAIQHVIEKLSGTSLSLQLPVFIYDDGTPPAAVSEDAMRVYLNAQYGVTIPADIFGGLPDDGDPRIEQLSYSSWRVTINYRAGNVRAFPPVTGNSLRQRFACQAQRRHVKWAPEIAVFGVGGGPFPSYGGMVDVQTDRGGAITNVGAVIEPPEPNLFVELAVEIGTISPSFGRVVAQSVGRFNTVALAAGAYQPGEIYLCSVFGNKTSAGEYSFDIAWSYRPNVSGQTRGSVTGIAYRGHDYVWEAPHRVIDRALVTMLTSPGHVVVNQVWDGADLSQLGIEPP